MESDHILMNVNTMSNSYEVPHDHRSELVLKNSPFLRSFLDFSGDPDARWNRIRSETGRIRRKIEHHHGSNWGPLVLRPFFELGERLEFFNEQLNFSKNREITSSLLFIGYELGDVSNLETIIDQLYAALRRERYYGETNSKIDDYERARRDSGMDAFIGELLSHGIFMKGIHYPEKGKIVKIDEGWADYMSGLNPDNF